MSYRAVLSRKNRDILSLYYVPGLSLCPVTYLVFCQEKRCLGTSFYQKKGEVTFLLVVPKVVVWWVLWGGVRDSILTIRPGYVGKG